jgi:hypothetical protein
LAANSGQSRVAPHQFWRDLLLKIPTVFGRLAFLSSLWDFERDSYREESLNRLLGDEDADLTIRHSHREVFTHWLTLGLAEQKADLSEYRRGNRGPHSQSEDRFLFRLYRGFIPASARPVERQLYLTDLETLLGLMRAEPDAFS